MYPIQDTELKKEQVTEKEKKEPIKSMLRKNTPHPQSDVKTKKFKKYVDNAKINIKKICIDYKLDLWQEKYLFTLIDD